MRKIIEGRVVQVTQDFIAWRDKKDWEAVSSKDYLLLEWDLLRTNEVEAGYDIVHDFIYKDMRVDVKDIKKFFNVSSGKRKIKWWNEGLEEGSLTHFLFVSSDLKPPLKVGDTVTYTYIGLCEAEEVLELLTPSFKVEGGYYIPMPLLRK
jgi:hypothetical protein